MRFKRARIDIAPPKRRDQRSVYTQSFGWTPHATARRITAASSGSTLTALRTPAGAFTCGAGELAELRQRSQRAHPANDAATPASNFHTRVLSLSGYEQQPLPCMPETVTSTCTGFTEGVISNVIVNLSFLFSLMPARKTGFRSQQ